MSDISVKKINKLIEEFEQEGNKVDRLEIGYKTYAVLMLDQKFADKVTKSMEYPKELQRVTVVYHHYLEFSLSILPTSFGFFQK